MPINPEPAAPRAGPPLRWQPLPVSPRTNAQPAALWDCFLGLVANRTPPPQAAQVFGGGCQGPEYLLPFACEAMHRK